MPCSRLGLCAPQPIEPSAVRLSFTSFTVRLFPRRFEFPIMAPPIPGPKPATRLFSRLRATSVGSKCKALRWRPPGRAGLTLCFLVEEMRAGASFFSIEDLKKDWPVLFIALPMRLGVARSGDNLRTLFVMLSGERRSVITRGRSVCVLFITFSEIPFRCSSIADIFILYYKR